MNTGSVISLATLAQPYTGSGNGVISLANYLRPLSLQSNVMEL